MLQLSDKFSEFGCCILLKKSNQTKGSFENILISSKRKIQNYLKQTEVKNL